MDENQVELRGRNGAVRTRCYNPLNLLRISTAFILLSLKVHGSSLGSKKPSPE